MKSPFESLWLSSRKMTVFANADENGIIVSASPVVRRFVGQSVDNLRQWMMRQGGFMEHRIFRHGNQSS